jgi:hypothetical protein
MAELLLNLLIAKSNVHTVQELTVFHKDGILQAIPVLYPI